MFLSAAWTFAGEAGPLNAVGIPYTVRSVNGFPLIIPTQAFIQQAIRQGVALKSPGSQRLAEPAALAQAGAALQWETPLTAADARLYAMFSAVDLNMNTYNHPPDQPADPQPANGATGVVVTTQMCWTCSDPDGDTLSYDVYLGTSAGDLQLVASNIYETCFTPTAPLEYETTYFWRIVAKDNEFTTEGPDWSFTTENAPHPPNAPTNPFPPHMAEGVSTLVEMTWEATDPDGDTLTFDVYFGTDANPPLVAENQAQARYVPGQLQGVTVYYWKIIAKDATSSTEGPIWWFRTTGTNPQPPNAPHDPNPPDASVGVDVELTLDWECEDPDGDTLTYTIYFGAVNPPPILQTGVTDSLFTLPMQLDYFTTYYWMIEAKDFLHDPVAGPVWSFRTVYDPNADSSAPDTTITTPTDGMCVNTRTYMIMGTAVDPADTAPSGVGQVEISIDGGATWEFAVVETPGAIETNWSYEWIGTADGSVTVMARATDQAGNVEVDYATVTFNVDTVRPTIWAAGWWDTNLSWDNGGSVTFMAIAPDPDIARIEIYYEGVGTGVYLVDDGTQGDWTAGDDIFMLVVSNVAPYSVPSGTYFLSLAVTDNCGNAGMVWPYLTVFPGESFAAPPPHGAHDWTKLLHNTMAKMAPDSGRPQVGCGGFYDSYITTTNGGNLTLMAYVQDPDGLIDIASVEIYYGGAPTGVLLPDDGTQGDWNAGDGLYMISVPVSGGIPAMDYLVEVVARDLSGNQSMMYPYLTVY